MKLFVLAGLATVFTGLAYGQATCTSTPNAVFGRVESNDDQVGDTPLLCNSGPAGIAANQTMTLQVYMTPGVNITSANISTGSTAQSEATAGINTAVGSATYISPVPKATTNAAPSSTVPGVVTGSSVTFPAITFPAPIAANTQFQVTITNIKIQDSAITVSGIPTAVSEQIFLSGTAVTPAAITTLAAVAYVTSGLSVSTSGKTIGASTNPLCNATNTWATVNGVLTAAVANFSVPFSEAFPNSFKVVGSAAANNNLGLEFTNHSETGYGIAAAAGNNANTATTGTRIKLIFNNIPSNVTLYVPISFGGAGAAVASAATNGAVLTLTGSESGSLSPVAGSSAAGAPGATSTSTNNGGIVNGTQIAAALTATSNSATAIYEVTTVSTAPGSFTIPVYVQAASGAVPVPPASAITATVSFGPINASSNVPNFVNGSSTTTVTGSTFVACATTLLFPFVTNQAGFESGLAISNTGADLLGTKNGAPASSVTGQSGTCTLTFFGNATASSNPPAFPTPAVIAPGTTWTSTLTSVTGGTPNTFGGYMFAVCNFLYAHGFTYISYNIGQSSGMAMGYLALAVNTPRTNSGQITVAVPAVVGGAAGAGGAAPVRSRHRIHCGWKRDADLR